LGADWLPSGSTGLLAELKVAERTLARQGHPLAPRQLVETVTATATSIAGLGDQLGTLEQGRRLTCWCWNAATRIRMGVWWRPTRPGSSW
jgi:hypothetical protein